MAEFKKVPVKGHYRKGQYVRPHTREMKIIQDLKKIEPDKVTLTPIGPEATWNLKKK